MSLALLSAAWLSCGSVMAQFDASKVYTIQNYKNDGGQPFMQDNGTGVVVLDNSNANSYWKFVATSNTDCYYIQNATTGKYIQGYSAKEQVVVTGDTGVEYYVKADASGTYAGKYRMSCTANSPYNFSAGTLGLNWKGSIPGTVQSFASVAGENARSAWIVTEAELPQPENETDLTSLITNNDFEETYGMIVDGTTFRGIPTGWHGWGIRESVEYTQEPGVNNTTLLPLASYGSNGGCSSTRNGDKSYWVNCTPMPDDFKLYQTVSLEAGNYQVRCLLTPMNTGNEYLTNLRLFAGDNACYFGSSDKYSSNNLGPETNRTFMDYTVTMDGNNEPSLKTMVLDFTLAEPANIQLGIRTSNMLADGTRSITNNGRFRVDYFCLHVHNYENNGICTCEGKKKYQEPALVDGYYEIKNAGNLEWFSNKVDEGGDANLQINAKLMNDIDMLSIENLHKPIGQTTGKKYNGTFDGQGHRIMNMIIERPSDSNIGFFGFLRGNAQNTTVKNLIMDKSCTIHGYNKVGGITGSCQNSSEFTITIENVINEATVIADYQDAAGIIGGHEGNGPKWYIHNVLNTGTITAKNEAPYAGALCCYLGGNSESVIENFVNLGTINGHKGGNIGRIAGTRTNIIDLSDTDFESSLETNYGLETGLTKEDIANGKLAYTVGWGQFIGTDTYPSPLNETEVKYIGTAGYSTFYNASNGFELNGDAKAYIGTLNGSNSLRLTEIDAIPANTAVVIGGTYYNMISSTATANTTGNILLGSDGTVTGGDGIYALAKPTGEEVGFYPVASIVTIPAGKAYLNTSAGVKGFTFLFDDDDATSLDAVNGEGFMVNGPIYNVAGQRLNKMQKGINIVNGKKIMVK